MSAPQSTQAELFELYHAQREFARRVLDDDIPSEDFPRTLEDVNPLFRRVKEIPFESKFGVTAGKRTCSDHKIRESRPEKSDEFNRIWEQKLMTFTYISPQTKALINQFKMMPRTLRENIYKGVNADAKKVLDDAFPNGPMNPDGFGASYHDMRTV
jgi:hypothetical protein